MQEKWLITARVFQNKIHGERKTRTDIVYTESLDEWFQNGGWREMFNSRDWWDGCVVLCAVKLQQEQGGE